MKISEQHNRVISNINYSRLKKIGQIKKMNSKRLFYEQRAAFRRSSRTFREPGSMEKGCERMKDHFFTAPLY
jgi:hypothetical protein